MGSLQDTNAFQIAYLNHLFCWSGVRFYVDYLWMISILVVFNIF